MSRKPGAMKPGEFAAGVEDFLSESSRSLITRPRTMLVALLLAGVALGPRCAGMGSPHADVPHPEVEKGVVAPHPDPLRGGEREKIADDGFGSAVRPVLLARCAPCHEPGGKMYARLPFDDAKTVSTNAAAISRRLKGDDRAALERWVAELAATLPAR